MIDRAGGSDQHVGGAIVAGEIGGEPGTVERAHGRGRAQDRAADRLAGERGFLQPVPDEIVRGVFRRADLLHDHVLLALQLLRVERRIGEDVGKHVERERHVGLEHARVVGRGLDRGGRVEVAADRLDLLGDLARAAPGCALERHVLEQMRDAVLVGALVAAAGADPDAERCRLQMRHRIGHDHQAGGKTRDFDAHAAAPLCAARLTERIWRSSAA